MRFLNFILFEGSLLNPSRFSMFFIEGRAVYGLAGDVPVLIHKYPTDADARDGLFYLLATIERNVHANRRTQTALPA